MCIYHFEKFFIGKTNSGNFTSNDACRMAAYFLQNGLCYITKTPLIREQRDLHHRKPKSLGGTDTPDNLILINKTVHALIHADFNYQIKKLLTLFPLNDEQLQFVNQLRLEASKPIITK